MLQIPQSQTWERNTLIERQLTPDPSRPGKYYLTWPWPEERPTPLSMIRTVSDPSHWTTKEKKYFLFLDAIWCKEAHLQAVPLPALKAWIGVQACGSEEQFNISPAKLFCLPARWIHSQFSSTLHFCRVKESSHSDYYIKPAAQCELLWKHSELQNTLPKFLLLQRSIILNYQIACANPHSDRHGSHDQCLHDQSNFKDILSKTLLRKIHLSELPTCLKRHRKETLTPQAENAIA